MTTSQTRLLLRQIKRAVHMCLGFREIYQRLDHQEELLNWISNDKWSLWLVHNRSERMDATVDFFPESRRKFHQARYTFASTYVQGKHVLDCASGTGYGCRLMKEAGATSVTGVEIDASAVQYANAKHKLPGVEFVCSAGETTPLESDSVDVITSFETIEHIHDSEKLLTEFARILRPGGTLIISTPNEWPISVAKHHVKEYSLDRFRLELERHFKVDNIYNQNSGAMDWKYNHQQPEGISSTTVENKSLAECYIAVCSLHEETESPVSKDTL